MKIWKIFKTEGNRRNEKSMALVGISLFPALATGVYIFGSRGAMMTLVCVAACIVFEAIFNAVTRHPNTLKDGSAAVTGIILSYLLPSGFPFWMAVTGCFVSIIGAKQIFGGFGRNILNPAAAGYAFLMLLFPGYIAHLPFPSVAAAVGGGAAASPLQLMAAGRLEEIPSYFEMFLGFTSGSFGTVSVIALLIGGAFLIWKKQISPVMPLSVICGIAVTAALSPGQDPVFHILTGGSVFGAIYLAGDFATTPSGSVGKAVFGLICGILTVIVRMSGTYIDGMILAVLIMNVVTPYIDAAGEKLCLKGEKQISAAETGKE